MATIEHDTRRAPSPPAVERPRPSPQELLSRIRALLEPVCGERLEGLVLFGSEARGEATEDSDVDVLVLFDGPVALGRDLKLIVRALYPLQMELDRIIEAYPVSADAFEAGEFGLYRSAKREGIRG